MNTDSLVKNLKLDYGLVDDNAKAVQSSVIQKAINEISAAGGGRLILPKGTYRFARIHFKLNVHLLIEYSQIVKGRLK